MALKDLHNKQIGFYTTLTNNNVDATHLPILMKNTGGIIISYNSSQIYKREYSKLDVATGYTSNPIAFVPNSADTTYWYETPHIWLGGEHIASGYGQDSLSRRNKLSYVADAYNAVWSYIQNNNDTLPIWVDVNKRSIILKDNDNYAAYNASIALGKGNIAVNENETVFGKYNYFAYNFDTHTLFSIGNGDNEYDRSNAVEVLTNGNIYINGIGTTYVSGEHNIDFRYNGKNALRTYTESFQSYISNAYSYSLNFTTYYINDRINTLVGGAPEVLDTLKEISDWISDNGETYTKIDYNLLVPGNEYYIWRWNSTIEDITKEINNETNAESKNCLVLERMLRQYYAEGLTNIVDILEKIKENKVTDNILQTAFNDIIDLYSNDEDTFTNTQILLTELEKFFKKYSIDATGVIDPNINAFYTLDKFIAGKEEYNFYNYLARFEIATDISNPNILYYELLKGTNLINQFHEVQQNYVSTYGNISYTWTNNYGVNAYTNTLFDILIEKPEYKKPYLDPDIYINDKLYHNNDNIEILKSNSSVKYKVLLKLSNTYTHPQYYNNFNNENLGMSYGVTGSFILNDKGLVLDSHENPSFISNININTETELSLAVVSYNYLYSSYMFYPQLLQKNIQSFVKQNYDNGWYSNNKGIDIIKLNAKYKYYYGWDNVNLDTANFGWINSTGNTESCEIPFTETHKAFWIAAYDNIKIVKTNNKVIYYYTNITPQDLVSNSVKYDKIQLGDYVVHYFDFNNGDYGIEGHPNEYIKFTLSK